MTSHAPGSPSHARSDVGSDDAVINMGPQRPTSPYHARVPRGTGSAPASPSIYHRTPLLRRTLFDDVGSTSPWIYSEKGASESPLGDFLAPVGIRASLVTLLRDTRTRWTLLWACFMCLFTLVQLAQGSLANSLALIACGFYGMVDWLFLFVELTGYVSRQRASDAPSYSYGWHRAEVLAAFSAASFFSFVCLYVMFEGVERMLEVEPSYVHSEILLRMAALGIGLQCLGTLVVRRVGLQRGPDSTWVQQGSGSGSASSSSSSPVLGGAAGGHPLLAQLARDCVANGMLFVCAVVIGWEGWMIMDTFGAMLVITFVLYRAIPVLQETSLILLQARPVSAKDVLDKRLREASTVEGVLECREVHFWTHAPSVIVGSICVRVRTDANEQAVLSAVTALFSRTVQHLTVQVEKDDWVL